MSLLDEPGRGIPDLPETELTTAELVRDVTDKVKRLAQKEIALARAEMKADFQAELVTIKGLAAAALCALFGVNLLLVAGALGLGLVIAPWLAAVAVGVALLAAGAAAGFYGWSKRVKDPLHVTRRSLEEDLAWAKRKLH